MIPVRKQALPIGGLNIKPPPACSHQSCDYMHKRVSRLHVGSSFLTMIPVEIITAKYATDVQRIKDLAIEIV